MRIFRSEYEHPTQASRVGLSVFETPQGFLALEDRSGPSTVNATLGAFAGRDEALARVQSRGEELLRQRYQLVAATAA
jgi:hypothetical protein